MAIHMRVLLWGALFVSSPFLQDGRLPWLADVWSALLFGALLLEVLAWIDLPNRLQAREEAERQGAEETRRRDREFAEEQAARKDQKERERHERIRAALDLLKSHVEAHAPELAARRNELVKYGRYGVPDFEDWIAEKEFFADEVVARKDPDIATALTRAQVLNAVDVVLDGRPMEGVVLDSTGSASSQTQSAESAIEEGERTCPACERRVLANERTCPQCGTSLGPPAAGSLSGGQDREQEPEHRIEASEPPGGGARYDRSTGRLSTISLVLAVPGVFLPGPGLFQLSALVVGIVALRRNKSRRPTRRWQAWVGTILGALYTVYFIVRFAQGYVGLY